MALELVPAGQSVGAPSAGQNEPAGHEPETAEVVPTGQYTPAAHGAQLLRLPDEVQTENAFWLQENVGVPK